MLQSLFRVLETFLRRFESLQSSCIKLGNIFICVSLITTSLLNLSYLYEDYQPSYTYICAIITRPQIFLNIEYFDYIISVIIVIYIMAALIERMPFRSYIAVFGELLRMNGLNFCFELCKGKYKLIPQSLIMTLFLNDSFFVQGTLNIKTINLQQTRNQFTHKLLALMMSIQMVLYTNSLNKQLFQIYVIIHSALLFFHQVLNQPHKQQNMSRVMASIEFITFYLGILKVANIYTKFTSELVLIPFIARIIWTSIEQRAQPPNDPHSIEEILIKSSILIQNQKYLEALNILEQKKNISILVKGKKDILYKSCLKEIKTLIYTTAAPQNKMAEAVNQLMESENINNKIQSQIINLIRSKIQQLKKLHDQQFNVFWELMEYTSKTTIIIEELKKYYSTFPTNKTQAILGFVYAEILNDFIASNKLFSIQALTEENNYQRRIIQETFSNQVAYLIADYKNGLIVQKTSNNLENVIEYDSKQLIGTSINCMIPPGIMEYHDKMVKEFLINGKSKFFRSIQENFYYKNETLYTIEFAIDTNFVDELKFISFLQPTQSRPLMIIINSENIIQCASQSLLQELNSLPIKNQPLKKFITNFELLEYENSIVENVKFTLPATLSMRQKNQMFNTSIRLQQKNINNQTVYQILRFEYFRKISQKDSENEAFNSQRDQYSIANENIEIVVPYTQKQYEILQSNTHEEIIQLYSNRSKQSPKQHLIMQDTNRNQSKAQSYQNSIKQFNLDKENNFDNNDIQLQFVGGQGDDQNSVISSIQGIRKSKYFKKYEIVDKLNGVKHYSQHHRLFYLFQGLNIFLYIILGTIELTQINHNLTDLAIDIDLLQIKNLVFMPTESFLVTRYNILQYRMLVFQRAITAAKQAELSAYPTSNLALGYDQLSENLHQVLNKAHLQQTIKDIELETYLYINTGQGVSYQMNLRGVITALLNFQYILKMAYQIDGSVSSDSPSFYFSYKNYRTLKDTFSNINEEILVQTISRSETMQYSIKILFIITLNLHFALIIAIILSYYQVKILYQKYTFLLMNIEKHIFDEEIIRYQKIMNLLEKDLNILFKYHNNIEQIENQMGMPYGLEGQKKMKVRKSKIQINLYNIRWMVVIFFSLIITNCTVTYYQASEYLSKYPATSKFYKDLSDVGTDIPTMYSQKEIYYLKTSIPYYTLDDQEYMINQILTALNRTKVFSQNSLNYNQLLISNDFRSYYQEITQSDLCNYIPELIKNRSQEICPQIMSSNMKRGLNSILVYIINSIETEYEINKFKAKLSSPILELEGAFILCQLINNLNKQFNNDLNQLTVDLLISINTYNFIFLITLALSGLAGSIKLKEYFQNQTSNVRKLLYLTPRRTLLTDDAFERNSKVLLITK